MNERRCRYCKNPIRGRRPEALYCSITCRNRAHNIARQRRINVGRAAIAAATRAA